MKTIVRIPTEQYAYIEFEIESDKVDAMDAIEIHNSVTKAYKNSLIGLPHLEFNEALDRYLWGDESMDAEVYAKMSIDQQSIIQEIKKSKKRVNKGE